MCTYPICASIWFFHSRADKLLDGWAWGGAEAEADWGCAKGVQLSDVSDPYPEIIRTMYNHEQLADEATDDSIAIRPIFTCEDRTYGRELSIWLVNSGRGQTQRMNE